MGPCVCQTDVIVGPYLFMDPHYVIGRGEQRVKSRDRLTGPKRAGPTIAGVGMPSSRSDPRGPSAHLRLSLILSYLISDPKRPMGASDLGVFGLDPRAGLDRTADEERADRTGPRWGEGLMVPRPRNDPAASRVKGTIRFDVGDRSI